MIRPVCRVVNEGDKEFSGMYTTGVILVLFNWERTVYYSRMVPAGGVVQTHIYWSVEIP